MLKKSLIAGFATLAIGFGMAATAPMSAANAGSFELRFSDGHGHVRIGNDHRRYKRSKQYRHHRATCRPGRAVHKAERNGVRRASVDRVNHRFVVVKGRKRGNMVRIAFHRDGPRCQVAWVKRGRSHGYRY